MSDTNKQGLIPIKNVRVPDPLWEAAGDEAKKRGEDRSKAINRFLEDYVAGKA